MLVPFVFTWPTTTAATTTTEMTMTTITMSDDKGGDVGDAKRLLTFTTNRWVDGSMWGFCWSYRCNFPELLRNDNMMAKVTRPRPVPSGLDLGLLMLWFWFVILWRFSFIHSSMLLFWSALYFAVTEKAIMKTTVALAVAVAVAGRNTIRSWWRWLRWRWWWWWRWRQFVPKGLWP